MLVDAFEKKLNTFNVLENGLVGDGLTNDWKAFSDLVTFAPAGSIIMFPPGRTYLMNSTTGIVLTKTLHFVAHGAKVVWASNPPENSKTLYTLMTVRSPLVVTGTTPVRFNTYACEIERQQLPVDKLRSNPSIGIRLVNNGISTVSTADIKKGSIVKLSSRGTPGNDNRVAHFTRVLNIVDSTNNDPLVSGIPNNVLLLQDPCMDVFQTSYLPTLNRTGDPSASGPALRPVLQVWPEDTSFSWRGGTIELTGLNRFLSMECVHRPVVEGVEVVFRDPAKNPYGLLTDPDPNVGPKLGQVDAYEPADGFPLPAFVRYFYCYEPHVLSSTFVALNYPIVVSNGTWGARVQNCLFHQCHHPVDDVNSIYTGWSSQSGYIANNTGSDHILCTLLHGTAGGVLFENSRVFGSNGTGTHPGAFGYNLYRNITCEPDVRDAAQSEIISRAFLFRSLDAALENSLVKYSTFGVMHLEHGQLNAAIARGNTVRNSVVHARYPVFIGQYENKRRIVYRNNVLRCVYTGQPLGYPTPVSGYTPTNGTPSYYSLTSDTTAMIPMPCLYIESQCDFTLVNCTVEITRLDNELANASESGAFDISATGVGAGGDGYFINVGYMTGDENRSTNIRFLGKTLFRIARSIGATNAAHRIYLLNTSNYKAQAGSRRVNVYFDDLTIVDESGLFQTDALIRQENANCPLTAVNLQWNKFEIHTYPVSYGSNTSSGAGYATSITPSIRRVNPSANIASASTAVTITPP